MFSNKSCLVKKSVPYEDSAQCHDHTSVGSFQQGIFNINSFDSDNYHSVKDWVTKNQGSIKRIECFLLKHPLFNFPVEFYFTFQFVHHAQLGFIFYDDNDTPLKHVVLQLQNSWWPSVDTVPFDLPQPCRLVKDDGTQKTILHFNDKTSILGGFLENPGEKSKDIITMNQYTVFKGLNLSFMNGIVNYNFFLMSYNLWRSNYTKKTTKDYEPKSKDNPIMLPVKSGQPGNTIGGSADGKLFVFNTFSPSYLSYDEGLILNFATIKNDPESKIENGCAENFNELISWTFRNLQCYDNVLQHTASYSRAYCTLSSSILNYNWVKEKYTNGGEALVNDMYNNNWNKLGSTWDSDDINCKLYDQIMDDISTGKHTNYFQDCKGELNGTNSIMTLLGDNYNCEIYARYMVSLLSKDPTGECFFDKGGTTLESHFDFSLPETVDSKKCPVDSDYSITENLTRAYTGTWPVAMMDENYESGILESDFNNIEESTKYDAATKAKLIKDRETYVSQSMLFSFLFNGNNINAAELTGNPLLKAITNFFGAPLLESIYKVADKRNSTTMLSALRVLMFSLFLYIFLDVDEVFLSGYRTRNLNIIDKKFDWNTTFDCEPAIYKFRIGKNSKAGIANTKLLEALLGWILQDTGKKLVDEMSPMNDKGLSEDLKNIGASVKDLLNKAMNNKDNPFNEDCTGKSGLEKISCNITKLEDEVKYIGEVTKDMASITGNATKMFTTLISNPLLLPEEVISELIIGIEKVGNKLYSVISGASSKFTTWCHLNYNFHPSVLHQRLPDKRLSDSDQPNKLGDFIRSKSGICSTLNTCKLLDKTNLIQKELDWKKKYYDVSQKLYLNMESSRASKSGGGVLKNVTYVVCIIVFILAVYVIFKN